MTRFTLLTLFAFALSAVVGCGGSSGGGGMSAKGPSEIDTSLKPRNMAKPGGAGGGKAAAGAEEK